MADPAAEHAAVQGVQTGFQPTVVPTQTRSIQLANYAPMMQAIEQAGQNILNSPLNPEVRSRMQLATETAQTEANRIKEWAADPNQRWKLDMLMSSQGGQVNVSPGYTTPQLIRAQLGPQYGTRNTQQVNPKTQDTPPTTTNTPQDNTNPQQPTNVQPQGPGFQFKTSQTDSGAPNYFASNGNGNAPAAPDSRTQATAPSVNPNLVASTDNDQLMRNWAAQQDQAKQQQLTQWQNNNVHPVVDAQTALNIYKRFNTSATSASYLPNAGPGGEPAISFGVKMPGGGHTSTMVPVSQLAKMGGGPDIASQNPSHVFSAAEQAQQAQQGAQPNANPPPSQGPQAQPGANQGGSPTPMSAQMGGPPPAPGAAPNVPNTAGTPVNVPQTPQGGTDWAQLPGQLPQDEFNRRVAAATNVTSAGGPPLDRFTAANNPSPQIATTDGNGVPKAGYNNGDRNLSGNPNFMEQNTGISNADLAGMRSNYQKNGSAQTNPNSMDPSHPDPKVGQSGDFSVYLSQGGTGPAYATIEGKVPFTEQRMYEGSDHWEPFDPPKLQLQRNLLQWDPSLDPDQINKMGKDEMISRLRQAYYIQKILPSTIPMDDGTRNNLNHLHDEILSANRIENAIKTMKPEEYGTTAQQANALARTGETLHTTEPHGPLGWFNNARSWVNGVVAGQQREDPRVSFVQDQMKNLEGLVKGRENEEKPFNQLGATMGATTFPTELHNWLNQRKLDYQRSVTGIMTNNQRIPGDYVDMANDLKTGKPLWDPGETYGSYQGPGAQRGPGAAAQAEHGALQAHGTASPSATPPPAAPGGTATGQGTSQASPIKVNSQQQYNALPVGSYYQDSTGRTFMKQPPRQR